MASCSAARRASSSASSRSNGRIQVVQVGKLLAQQEDVVRLQPTNDRLGERLPLGAQSPARQLG